MALPLLILIPSAIAALTGAGAGVNGGSKMKKANDTLKKAQEQNKKNLSRLETSNKACLNAMDLLGRHEMEILASFKEFSQLFERLHNRPEFKELKIGEVQIPAFDPKKIEEVSVGASLLLGGLGGAALGTAGAFAASSATTTAVMALGTASTGTAIASLSGVAATNATLAALGGGSLAAGGGGMALGSMVLGGATLGVGLLVGGVIFGITGARLSKKADEAYAAMKENEAKINPIVTYMVDLKRTATKYDNMLMRVNSLYASRMKNFRTIMKGFPEKYVDWNELAHEEKRTVEALVLLVGVLYNMCKVQLVKQSASGEQLNQVNHDAVKAALKEAESVAG